MWHWLLTVDCRVVVLVAAALQVLVILHSRQLAVDVSCECHPIGNCHRGQSECDSVKVSVTRMASISKLILITVLKWMTHCHYHCDCHCQCVNKTFRFDLDYTEFDWMTATHLRLYIHRPILNLKINIFYQYWVG